MVQNVLLIVRSKPTTWKMVSEGTEDESKVELNVGDQATENNQLLKVRRRKHVRGRRTHESLLRSVRLNASMKKKERMGTDVKCDG